MHLRGDTKYIRVEDVAEEQDDKPLHVQAAEVHQHIENRDYGLAGLKVEILLKCLIEDDSNIKVNFHEASR